ncbi:MULTISPECIES: hypothetical protein [unclassified Photorhabdus]|uniref:hypothetical protein n=1 Tax=unclassified Photorhabdus TaxID=2620880 RepID=UPI001EFD485B|nr:MULTISPECIES: hypothetical protein [unclassified Photorhabdus]
MTVMKALLWHRDALLGDIQRKRNRYEKSGSTRTQIHKGNDASHEKGISRA